MEDSTIYGDKREKLVNNLYATYRKKNHDYGDSFGKSCDKYGLIAAIVRMNDKVNRFAQLIDKDSEVQESIQDTLLDLANYSIMTIDWLSGSKEDDSIEFIYAQLLDNLSTQKEKPLPEVLVDFKKWFYQLEQSNKLNHSKSTISYSLMYIASLACITYLVIERNNLSRDNFKASETHVFDYVEMGKLYKSKQF